MPFDSLLMEPPALASWCGLQPGGLRLERVLGVLHLAPVISRLQCLSLTRGRTLETHLDEAVNVTAEEMIRTEQVENSEHIRPLFQYLPVYCGRLISTA